MSATTCEPNIRPEAVEAELEAQADRLLWQERPPCELEYSFCHETTLARSVRRDRGQIECPPPAVHDPLASEEVLGELLEALLAEACLGEGRRRVLALARRGLSQREIAEALGIKLRTAQRWHRQGLAQLRRYCAGQVESEAARNLREAYREQLSIGAQQRERHCTEGREACRHDGLCKYRWYLHGEAGQEA